MKENDLMQKADEDFINNQIKDLEKYFSEVEKRNNVYLKGDRHDLNTKAKEQFKKMTKAEIMMCISQWKYLMSLKYSQNKK